jgi:hypothetical protein
VFKILLKILIISFSISIITGYATLIINRKYYQSDFLTFFSAAQIITQQPQLLYHPETHFQYQLHLIPEIYQPDFQFIPYIYPPFYTLLLSPLTNFPPQTSYFIFAAINLIIYLISLVTLNRLFKIKHSMWIILIALTFEPAYVNLFLSQTAFWILLCFILIYQQLKQHHFLATGLLSSMLIIKPQFTVILYPYLLTQSNKKITTGLIGGIIILILSNEFVHPGYTQFFINSLINALPNYASEIRISIAGIFYQLQTNYPATPSSILTIITSLLLLSLTMKKLRQLANSKASLDHIFNIIILTTLLAGIAIQVYDAILLLIPFYSLIKSLPKNRQTFIPITLGWTIFFLPLILPSFDPQIPFIITGYLVCIYIYLIYLKSNHYLNNPSVPSHKHNKTQNPVSNLES